MRTKAVISMMSAIVISFLLMGTAMGASYTAISTDKESYSNNETVIVTYDGLGGASYAYPVKMVILDDSNTIVASSAVIPEVAGDIVFVWNWDQVFDDGSSATGGVYHVTGAYFYADGTVGLWGSVDGWTEFSIGQQGPGPHPTPGPKP